MARASKSMITKRTGFIDFENFKLKEIIYILELSTYLLLVNAIIGNGKKIIKILIDIVSLSSVVCLSWQRKRQGSPHGTLR